ncbi:uncharacterized protein MONBRDRAFT_10470 [Monosiga brevicollis MX1]|uniref:Uncharacterized protein n=1 Tax=Monosiga brevicollis TaxID=81824 RepID=A9V6A5_MONBE|nr:uncharacterized protein MONBRDRAFT_10470 [Monosiga brevicollis MX1]EDQ87035.1 predicted protein [Monosiga brevicollis MX1]|eukprot:XP_001748274.1 hypothetical protein [Monosiga brevicollis MX1]
MPPRHQEEACFDTTELAAKVAQVHHAFAEYLDPHVPDCALPSAGPSDSVGQGSADATTAVGDRPRLEVLPQAESGSRYRCLFQLLSHPYRYARRKHGIATALEGDEFVIAAPRIKLLMRAFLEHLASDDRLAKSCRSLNFHVTLSDDSMLALVYEEPLDEVGWREAAEACRTALGLGTIVGRAKKQCIALPRTHVLERFPLQPGLDVYQQQEESIFSNPSAPMCLQTMQWLVEVARQFGGTDLNLLELYSGSGTYTPAMCSVFAHVLSVEIQRTLVEAARRNLELNHCESRATVHRAPVEFCRRLLRSREHEGRRYDAVLLDPPRDGLDDFTRSQLHNFEVVMLISCSPLRKLILDAEALHTTHRLARMVILDHFPGTRHLEAAVVFVRHRTIDAPVAVDD